MVLFHHQRANPLDTECAMGVSAEVIVRLNPLTYASEGLDENRAFGHVDGSTHLTNSSRAHVRAPRIRRGVRCLEVHESEGHAYRNRLGESARLRSHER